MEYSNSPHPFLPPPINPYAPHGGYIFPKPPPRPDLTLHVISSCCCGSPPLPHHALSLPVPSRPSYGVGMFASPSSITSMNAANVDQSTYCDICNIKATRPEDLAIHKRGKKHKKNLKALKAPAEANEAIVAVIKESPSTYCDVCKVSCTCEEDLNSHKQGKKHEKNLKKQNESVAAYCDVCKVNCTSEEDLNSHKQGKKHENNLRKQNESVAALKALIKVKEAVAVNKQKKRKEAPCQAEDLEAKKKRLLENGMAEKDLRVCNICTTVMNGEAMYNSHIKGRKHIELAKKQQEAMAS